MVGEREYGAGGQVWLSIIQQGIGDMDVVANPDRGVAGMLFGLSQ
jgi:hypothetical protein